MGIVHPTNIINIYQTALQADFKQQIFIVTNPSTKTYDVGETIIPGSDVVTLNGLYQIRGSTESYTTTATAVVFNATTILSVGDNIQVFYTKGA
jgi:hypothetical protein